MYAKNYLNNRQIFIIALILSSLTIFFIPYVWAGILLMVFLFAGQMSTTKDIILFFIFSLLVISGDISEILRGIFNSAAILFLAYVFFKEYGLKISSYPKLSKFFFYFILLVFSSMVISAVFSSNILVGFNEILRFVIFFIIWYCLYSFINEDGDLFRYSGVLVASGTMIAMLVIYSFIISNKELYLLETLGLVQEGGVFKNVAAAGGILAVSIPITTIFLLYNNNIKKGLFYFLYVLLFIQVFGMFLTNSRAAILAMGISLAIILFILKRRLFYKLAFLSLGLSILVFFILPAISGAFETYFRVNRVLHNTRYYLWDMSFGIIKDNPIFGTGPGLFRNFMYKHLPVILGSWEEQQIRWIYDLAEIGQPHNFIIFRTVETGILGFITAILLPVVFIYHCLKVLKFYFTNKKIYFLTIGILAVGIGLFVRSFFESTGLISNGWISRDLPFWLCFAMIIYLYTRKREPYKKFNENPLS